MKPTARFWVTLLFGWCGAHKFIDRKIGMGLLYLCTFGLCGIGWLVDTLKALRGLFPRARQVKASRSPSAASKTVAKPAGNAAPVCSPIAHYACFINLDAVKKYERSYIAFDVETTGLNPSTDRIVELSAVIFEGCSPVRRFSTLINPKIPMPKAASEVNGITDSMLRTAPPEETAIAQFLTFIGEGALQGETLLVAHNANFDIKFLLHACSRCGISSDFSFLDTLALSRETVSGLTNYKLGTVAAHFDIPQITAHRAEDDAEVCGKIFANVLRLKREMFEARLAGLTPAAKALCEWVKRSASAAGLDTQLLSFASSAYLTADYATYQVLKAKPNAKKPYILLDQPAGIPDSLECAPATKSEGECKVRVYFSDPADLDPIAPIIVAKYRRAEESSLQSLEGSERRMKELAKTLQERICI